MKERKERIYQLDYLKGIFILLMVMFHLSPVVESYPVVCNAVYTFHIPAFLIISGYLTNVDKGFKDFIKGMFRLIVPYMFFETLYLLAISFLGVYFHTSNSVEDLSLSYYLYKVLECPIGTYWYLHTLVICSSIYYLVYRVFKLKSVSGIAMTGIILYGLALLITGFKWNNVIYFLLGIYILRCGKTFLEMIPPSFIVVLPLIILFSSSDNFNRGSLAGITITLLTISFLLFVYNYSPKKINKAMCYVGKNSLSIVVFSPIFTIATRLIIPFFQYDQTKISFVIIALCFVVFGSLLSARLCDKLGISRFIFCKEKFYVSYDN